MTTPTARRPATIALPRAVPATAAPVVPAPAVPPSVAPAVAAPAGAVPATAAPVFPAQAAPPSVAPALAVPVGTVPATASRTVAVLAVEFPTPAVQEVDRPAAAVPATTPPAMTVPTAPVRTAAGPVVAADGAAAGLRGPGARRAPAKPPPDGTPGSPLTTSPGRSSSRPRARSASATGRPGSTTTGGGALRNTATVHRGSPRSPRKSSPNGSPGATPDDAGGGCTGSPPDSPPVATRADSLPALSKRAGRRRCRSSGFPLLCREAYATGLPFGVHPHGRLRMTRVVDPRRVPPRRRRKRRSEHDLDLGKSSPPLVATQRRQIPEERPILGQRPDSAPSYDECLPTGRFFGVSPSVAPAGTGGTSTAR